MLVKDDPSTNPSRSKFSFCWKLVYLHLRKKLTYLLCSFAVAFIALWFMQSKGIFILLDGLWFRISFRHKMLQNKVNQCDSLAASYCHIIPKPSKLFIKVIRTIDLRLFLSYCSYKCKANSAHMSVCIMNSQRVCSCNQPWNKSVWEYIAHWKNISLECACMRLWV